MARRTNVRRRARVNAPAGDVVVTLSKVAVQKFLNAHFKNNPDFYDRSRERLPNNPVFEKTFNDHGTTRRVRFWAKVEKPDPSSPAVVIEFRTPTAVRERFEIWWRAAHHVRAAADELPRNIALTIPRAVLQVNFPKLDGAGGEHKLDLPFTIEVQTYAKLASEGGRWVVQLINWDIVVRPLDDPIDPDDPIWGPNPSPPCLQEVKRLRLIIRDLFTVGANVVLTQLGETLTQRLPLPPFDIVKGVSIDPRELEVTPSEIALAFSIGGKSLAEKVDRGFQSEMIRFEEELGDTDIGLVLESGPLDDPAALDQYMIEKVPAYSNLNARFRALQGRSSTRRSRPPRARSGPDLSLAISANVFDTIAKALLRADQSDCTDWLTLDVGLGYGSGRACYWFRLGNARGSLAGTTVSMGCDFDAGGKLELRFCVRNPCGPDACTSWSPGLGLDGPCDLAVTLSTQPWNKNRALKASARFSTFPGFRVYGIPKGLGEIVNAIINFLTSVVLRAFFNAILSAIDIYIVEIDERLPGANVKVKVSDFGVSNVSGRLVLTGKTTFT